MSLDNLVLIKEIDGEVDSRVSLYLDKVTNHNYAVKK
jgi:hypothetical protein